MPQLPQSRWGVSLILKSSEGSRGTACQGKPNGEGEGSALHDPGGQTRLPKPVEVAGFVLFQRERYPLLMIPSIGRIVHYTLTEQDAEQINRRRADASAMLNWHCEHKTGAVVHIGNPVAGGDVYPLLITRTWGDQADSAINGQVFLDGSDLLRHTDH
jgi:hypothetical protein